MNPQHGKEVKWEALILILNLFMILKEDWDVESRALFPAFIQICQFVPSLDLKKKNLITMETPKNLLCLIG